jgi:hypothetical protein
MFKTIEQSNQLPVLNQPFTNLALAAPEPPHTPKEAVGGGMPSRLLIHLAEKVRTSPPRAATTLTVRAPHINRQTGLR